MNKTISEILSFDKYVITRITDNPPGLNGTEIAQRLRLTDAVKAEATQALNQLMLEDRTALLDQLVREMPKKYEAYVGIAEWQVAHNKLVDEVTALLNKAKGEL